MKTASEFVNEKLGDKNYTHSPYPMHREEIIAWLNEFASQNPERVMDKIIELSLDFQKEYLPNAGASYHYQAEAWAGIKEFTVWLNQKHISDLCSGSQDETEKYLTNIKNK